MKYHSQLLKKYISLNCPTQELIDNFIVKTAEVEETIERKISNTIVIGKLTSVKDHPDSDHMHICQVNCGDKGSFQIVCGANNVAEGMYVPVALEGTVFENLWITISKRKLRGIDSNGMICSKNELGINEDANEPRIWDLSKDFNDISDADLWCSLTQKYERINSTVLDIDNTGISHTPHLTGHFWAAWDFNATYAEQGKVIYNKLKEYQDNFKHTNIYDLLENTEKKAEKKVICKTKGLHNYILLELKNVQVKPTDFFMRLQNIDLGNSSINNWVDFSNIFMNIAGQPVHFFDADKIEGNIIVRNAEEGEIFIDLFGKEHHLKTQDIVIADEKKVLCLGGVMGGENSGITENTKNIIVEIANFDAVSVRKTWVRLGLRSESELRNEKNINPLYSLYALLLFLDELKFYKKTLGDYELWWISYYIDQEIHPIKQKEITVNRERIEQFIFWSKKENFREQAIKILENLGFEVFDNKIIVPLRRGPEDINIEADIVEEIIRIYGYEKIDTLKTQSSVESKDFNTDVATLRSIEETLTKICRYSQLETYPWISDKMLQAFWKGLDHVFKLENPVNVECPYLRDSLIYHSLQNVIKNYKFFDTIRIFDTGKIWNTTEKESTGEYAREHIDEQTHTGILCYKKSITNREDDPLLEIKATVEEIIKNLGLQWEISYKWTNETYFHTKKQGEILYNGEKIGFLGTLHPLFLKEFKLPETSATCYAEINQDALNTLINNNTNSSFTYETLQDQIIWRDLCFVVNQTDSYEKLFAALKNIEEIKDIKVFDMYQGENLPEWKKSLSLQIKIIGDGNMTNEEIGIIMQKAITEAKKIWAELRE